MRYAQITETQAEGLRSQSTEQAREEGPSRAARGPKGACQGLMPVRCSEYPSKTNSKTE